MVSVNKWVLLALVFWASQAFGDTYWVSPSGSADWNACKSVNDPGSNYCSLATANSSATAGDVVLLKGGSYTGFTNLINPQNSGTLSDRITFKNAPGETPTLSPSTILTAITVQQKKYITIDGINAYNVGRFFFIGYGAEHIEISNGVFDRSVNSYVSGAITDSNTGYTANIPTKNIWIHHNTFSRYGRENVTSNCQVGGQIRIVGSSTDTASYNTIENNVFFQGGHDCIDVAGKYNVVKNNIFHNEEVFFIDPGGCGNSPASGFFGQRNILLTDYGEGTNDHNLIEGNRVGHAGTPPDKDSAHGIETGGRYTVVRYNYIFGNGAAGFHIKQQKTSYGNYARVFNNTFYKNGYGDEAIADTSRAGLTYICKDGRPYDVIVKNNIVFDNYRTHRVAGSSCVGEITYLNNFERDPKFLDTNMKDRTSRVLPDLRFSAGSEAIDKGRHLTTAKQAGVNSRTLVVYDALYFQDGSWGSGLAKGVTHFADWIAIGKVSDTAEISYIDYSTNTITLRSPLTWEKDAPIYLFRKSDGAQTLYGSAPDVGAYEYPYPGGISVPTIQSIRRH